MNIHEFLYDFLAIYRYRCNCNKKCSCDYTCNYNNTCECWLQKNIYYKKALEILHNKNLKRCDYKKIHHNLCKLMFEYVKSGNEIWIQINEIYSTTNNEHLDESTNYIRISILSRNMLEYDRNMFQLLSSESEDSELAKDVFRPYFLHFLIDVSKIDEKSRTFISNYENLGLWYYGSINKNDKDGFLMEGLLESSASPVHYEKRHLIIKNVQLSPHDLHNINITYDAPSIPSTNDRDVENRLQIIFDSPKFSKVRTYNVGNGNCIYLKGKSGKQTKRLLYDIGYNMGGHPNRHLTGNPYARSMHAIRSMKPDCIILSHWDLDHIMGCAYAPQHLFHCTWIAPTFPPNEKPIIGARRLAVYLNVIGSLMLVARSVIRTDAFARLNYTDHSQISFWMGLGAHGSISAINGEGIIIEIENTLSTKHFPEKMNCLLPGDVPYSSLPNGVNLIRNASIDYLVVPHHGSSMDFTVLRRTTACTDTCAFISASGVRNLPTNNHLNELNNKHFNIFVTRDAGFYIEFSLLRSNDVLVN